MISVKQQVNLRVFALGLNADNLLGLSWPCGTLAGLAAWRVEIVDIKVFENAARSRREGRPRYGRSASLRQACRLLVRTTSRLQRLPGAVGFRFAGSSPKRAIEGAHVVREGSGCSIAAKWPPFGISVQRRMFVNSARPASAADAESRAGIGVGRRRRHRGAIRDHPGSMKRK